MSFNENDARHSIPSVKMTKHFIGISDRDADSYGELGHNAGNFVVNFLNPNVTNVSSASDATKTTLHPISMSIDVVYYNVSENFRNNRFRVRSKAGNLLRHEGGTVTENGTNPTNPATYDPKTFPVIIIPDGIYKTGAEFGAAVLGALNLKAIFWVGGQQLLWTNTGYDVITQSMRFRLATAAPAGTPELFIEAIYTDPDTGIVYDSSRTLGTTSAVVGPNGYAVETDGAFVMPYTALTGGFGVATPSIVDLQTVDIIQLRCPQIAKRYFRKQGSNPVAGRNPLSFVPILFEIPLDTVIGGTFFWMPQDDRYSQEISSDFSTMTIQLTTKTGQIIPWDHHAEFNFQFYVEREIHVASNADRIKAMSEYNRFKSF